MGHRINPFEITATRSYSRTESDKTSLLVLSSLGATSDYDVDLLDSVEEHIIEAESVKVDGGAKQFSIVKVRRNKGHVVMVVACDTVGEWETVRERSSENGSPVVFRKTDAHMSRIYSYVLLHRPPGGKEGLLLVHKPWGRGPSGPQVGKLIQRAVRATPSARATVKVSPLIDKALALQMLRNQEATKIAYRKKKLVVDPNDANKTVEVEWDIAIKGKATAGVRRAFKRDLIKKIEQDMETDTLMTLSFPEADGQEKSEQFEDVRVSLGSSNQGTTGTYSILEQDAPRMALVRDKEMQALYADLRSNVTDGSPDDDHDDDDDEIQSTLLERGQAPMIEAARSLGYR